MSSISRSARLTDGLWIKRRIPKDSIYIICASRLSIDIHLNHKNKNNKNNGRRSSGEKRGSNSHVDGASAKSPDNGDKNKNQNQSKNKDKSKNTNHVHVIEIYNEYGWTWLMVITLPVLLQ